MAPATKRKLIDIKQPVFQILSLEAERESVSLKRLIENKLEEAAIQYSARNAGNLEISPNIRRLIGSAKPAQDLAQIEDDRLQYILSK